MSYKLPHKSVMIGDVIRLDDKSFWAKTHNGKCAIVDMDLFHKIYMYEERGIFAPVKITKELLLLLGFVSCYDEVASNEIQDRGLYSYLLQDSDIIFDFNKTKIVKCSVDGKILLHIKYLHQLQQLHRALNDKELTIPLDLI